MIISDFLNMLLSGGLTTFVIVIILAILIASYKKASPNEVLIDQRIAQRGKKSRARLSCSRSGP